MKKNISSIRQNINKRKQEKRKMALQSPPRSSAYINDMIMEDEERHGYVSTGPSYLKKSSDKKPIFHSFLLRSVIAACLFFVMTLSYQSNVSILKQPKEWTSYVLHEEFPFATMNAWYQSKFGAPFAVEPIVDIDEDIAVLPVSGQIDQSFQENGQGLMISTVNKSDVIAVNAGTVLFAGNDADTGKTVIVQHADRSKTIYGFLSDIQVHSYQSVRSNQVIGSFKPSDSVEAIYFAVEKNREFIDPVQVIHVHEQQ